MNTFIAKVSGKLHEARISNVNYELGKVKESIIHESSSYVGSIISRSESIRFSQLFSGKRASEAEGNDKRPETSRLPKSSSLPAISSSYLDTKKYKYKSSLQCPDEADEEGKGDELWSPVPSSKNIDESVVEKFIRVVEVKEPAVRRSGTAASRVKVKTREDIRKKLAFGGIDSAGSAPAPLASEQRVNGYKRGFQDTSGGDLQICFINQVVGNSDEEDDGDGRSSSFYNRNEEMQRDDSSEDKDSLGQEEEKKGKHDQDIIPGLKSERDSSRHGCQQSPDNDNCNDTLVKRRVTLRKRLAKLQKEVKCNLQECRQIAKRQIDRSKNRRFLNDPLGKLMSLPALDPEATCGRKFDAAFLHTLNEAKLQIIVNHYHNDFERLNEELMQLLLAKDELQIEQDGQLLDIEDLSCSFRLLSFKTMAEIATDVTPSDFVIRPYNARDKDAVKELLNEATMSTVHRFSVIAIRRDVVAQSVLIMAASIFILIGLPLHYCLVTFPGIVAFVYFSVWLAHKVKVWTTHGDLDNIESEYQYAKRTGFWVAEEKASGLLMGTIAVIVKQDPDMREPPNSVAQIRRMAVSKGWQKRGIGQKLLDTAVSHCHNNKYRAIELITTGTN